MNPVDRRTVLTTIGGAGVLGAAGGVTSATGSQIESIDPNGLDSTIEHASVMAVASDRSPPTLEGTVTHEPVAVGPHILVGTTRGLYSFDEETLEFFIPTKPVERIEPIDSDRVVLLLDDLTFPNVRCIDVSDGSQVWATSQSREVYSNDFGLIDRQLPVLDVVVSDRGAETTVTVSAGYNVFAIDAGTGEIQWTVEYDFYAWQLAVMEGTLYVSTQEGSLRALSVDDGEEIFRRSLVEPFEMPQRTIPRSVWSIEASPEGDELVVTTEDGTVMGLNPNDGDTRWSVRILEPTEDDLESYYRQNDRRPTSIHPDGSDGNFFNVDVIGTGVGTQSGVLISVIDSPGRGETRRELVLVDPSGEEVWSNDDVDLNRVGNVFYDPSVDPDTVYLPSVPEQAEWTIDRIDVESGNLRQPLTLPSFSPTGHARRRTGVGFVGSLDGDLVVTSSDGDLVGVSEEKADGSDTQRNGQADDEVIEWRVPSIQLSDHLRGDFSGGGSDSNDVLVRSIEQGVRQHGQQTRTRTLFMRSGADGTIDWHVRLDDDETDIDAEALLGVSPIQGTDATDVIAIADQARAEAGDDMRDLETELNQLEDERQHIHQELEDLHESEDDRGDLIESLEAELAEIDAEIDAILEQLDEHRGGELLVLSGRNGELVDTIELSFEDTGDPSIEARSMAVIDGTDGDARHVVVADEEQLAIIDIDTRTPSFTLSFRDIDDLQESVGEFVLETVKTPDGSPSDVLVFNTHDPSMTRLETTEADGDVTATVSDHFNLTGDRLNPTEIDVLSDITGDGFDDVVVGSDDGGSIQRHFISSTSGPLVTLEAEGIQPGLSPVPAGVEADVTLIGMESTDREIEVVVYDGTSQTYSHEFEMRGGFRGAIERSIQPAAFAGDVDGSGTEALAIPRSSSEGGTLVEFHDVRTGEILDSMILERFPERIDPDEDVLEPALFATRLPAGTMGDNPIVGIVTGSGTPETDPDVFLVDAVERRLVASGQFDAIDIIELENGIGLIGSDGSLQRIDDGAGVTLSVSGDGAERELNWTFDSDEPHVTTVYVNNLPVEMTENTDARVRLPNGTHQLSIRAEREDGFSVHDGTEVSVDASSIARGAVTALAGLSIIALFGAALIDTVKGRVGR